MAKRELAPRPSDSDVATTVATAILGFIADIPKSTERSRPDPSAASRSTAHSAAAKAAMAAGTLALPPGPLGWLTILPEMVIVWKIQAQMVSDIAAYHGKKATLTKEQMIYCLFKHTAAQAVRDLVVRVGERTLVQRASLRVQQTIAQKIGVQVSQRAIGKGLSRWLPIVGAVGVGAYAYFDTAQVATTAIALFSSDIDLQPSVEEVD